MKGKDLDLESIAMKVRLYRIEHNLSQEKLAQKAGVPVSRIIKIEAGKDSTLSLPYMLALSEALGINLNKLIFNEGFGNSEN